MKLASISVLRLFACAALLCTVLAANAADPAGTWTWTQQGRQGGEPREVSLKITKDGDKYMGTLVSPGRGDNATPVETKINDIKVAGEEITFTVTREFQGNSFTAKYSGKIADDSITGKIETERDGQTRSRDWTAKRKKA
jgi:hypothetical protein